MKQPMFIKFSDALLAKMDNPLAYLQSHYARKIVTWMINPQYRTIVALEPWVDEQVKNPTPAVMAFANRVLVSPGDTEDVIVIKVLRQAIRELNYVPDTVHWNLVDKWSTADETLTQTVTTNGITWGPMEGDCEDGALLIYVVARILGVEKERLFIWCGDVVGGGHASCIYIPESFPFNFVFLDWCYYPEELQIDQDRTMYSLNGKAIAGESVMNGTTTGRYDTQRLSTWFIFNEENSFTDITYKVV